MRRFRLARRRVFRARIVIVVIVVVGIRRGVVVRRRAAKRVPLDGTRDPGLSSDVDEIADVTVGGRSAVIDRDRRIRSGWRVIVVIVVVGIGRGELRVVANELVASSRRGQNTARTCADHRNRRGKTLGQCGGRQQQDEAGANDKRHREMGDDDASKRSPVDRGHCATAEDHAERDPRERLEEPGGNENGPLVGGAGCDVRQPARLELTSP